MFTVARIHGWMQHWYFSVPHLVRRIVESVAGLEEVLRMECLALRCHMLVARQMVEQGNNPVTERAA